MAQINAWASNLHHNVSRSLANLTVYDYIRLVIIIGGYCLLRPYLIQLGARFQAKDHERKLDSEESHSSPAAVSPNSLRGQIGIPEDSEEEDVGVVGPSWGQTARRRQRQLIRRILDEEERRRAEEDPTESDKEIEQFLIPE
ncbi:DUF1531-domain-containing protein [Xylona heveae TC161]|uniref:DUF1531-domain-containing protein n=1 Tax=Xylona heveae (strain CBS 132557 / TC161) TaxID=1328760 RepID=A0A164ZUB3_XYLHT|nr:DUF1531-domain-containing protein [Xylona heveae TC161]KZF19530.1 DUF1531-domain-containing protein [Xylona heveae TC161]